MVRKNISILIIIITILSITSNSFATKEKINNNKKN